MSTIFSRFTDRLHSRINRFMIRGNDSRRNAWASCRRLLNRSLMRERGAMAERMAPPDDLAIDRDMGFRVLSPDRFGETGRGASTLTSGVFTKLGTWLKEFF